MFIFIFRLSNLATEHFHFTFNCPALWGLAHDDGEVEIVFTLN